MRKFLGFLLAALMLLAVVAPVMAEGVLTPADDFFAFTLKAEEVNAEWQRLREAMQRMEGFPQSAMLEEETLLPNDVEINLEQQTNSAYTYMSPNGEYMLTSYFSFPSYISLKDGTFRFLVPQDDLSEPALKGYLDMAYKLLQSNQVYWSPDGLRAVTSAPYRVFQHMVFGENLQLLDFENGNHYVVDKPFMLSGVSGFKDASGYDKGIPNNAVFKDNQNLYVFYYGVVNNGEQAGEIRVLDIATGEFTPFAAFPNSQAGIGPLAVHEGSVIFGYNDYAAPGKKGLAVFTPDGQRKDVLWQHPDEFTQSLEAINVADFKGGKLMVNLISNAFSKPINVFTAPVAVAEMDESMFSSVLALDANNQVVLMDPSPMYTDETYKAVGSEITQDGKVIYRFPSDVALSPDGNSVLLAFSVIEDGARFFLYDLAAKETREVTMEEDYPYMIYRGGMMKMLKWQPGGLISILPRESRETVFFTLK